MLMAQLASIMKKHGIVGAGGAGFPSYAKISEKADTIILNCAECEPLLKLHRQLLEKYAYEVLKALDEVAKSVKAKKVFIAVKKSYKKAIEAVKSYISDFKNMEISLLPDVYPSGDEIVLSYEVTKKVIAPGSIPITKGIIVYNVETMLNLYNAINSEKNVTHKYVTVIGEVKKPITVCVPIGTKVASLISMAGGTTKDDITYISGGPMMGNTISEFDVVTKTTNAIIALENSNIVVQRKNAKTSISMKRAMSSCCQCQMCTDMCPRHALGHPIEPHMFMRAASSGVIRDIKPMINTMYCCGCGVCELYACPQGLSPRTLIAEYKDGLRKNGIKASFDGEATKDDSRELRKVPMNRLISRLGLSKYNVKAPISDEEFKVKQVKIMLSQHIGVSAVPTVKINDRVTENDLIADVADDKLGVPIHTPIRGTVIDINDSYILIKEID